MLVGKIRSSESGFDDHDIITTFVASDLFCSTKSVFLRLDRVLYYSKPLYFDEAVNVSIVKVKRMNWVSLRDMEKMTQRIH